MITIDDLNEAFYAASCVFDTAQQGDFGALSKAIELQNLFDEKLTEFKTQNPDVQIFIDVINKTITEIEESPDGL